MSAQLRIIFMGTPDFAVPALQKLLSSQHKVIAVYSQPPRPKGRGQNLQKSPVHICADAAGIPVLTPHNLKKDIGAIEDFRKLDADIAVVAAYGLILPKAILEAPVYGCLNIHASLLPRWRGAAPIQYAIWKGDAKSGVTIMQMEEGLDTGPMLLKTETDITSDTTAQSLHDDLAIQGAEAILEVVNNIAHGAPPAAIPQDNSLSTYAAMLKKEDGAINWNEPAIHIDRQIRALNPWPGTYFDSGNGKRFKVRKASLSAQKTQKAPGTLLSREGDIACGAGSILRLEQIQPENKQVMDIASAINGGYLQLS